MAASPEAGGDEGPRPDNQFRRGIGKVGEIGRAAHTLTALCALAETCKAGPEALVLQVCSPTGQIFISTVM